MPTEKNNKNSRKTLSTGNQATKELQPSQGMTALKMLLGSPTKENCGKHQFSPFVSICLLKLQRLLPTLTQNVVLLQLVSIFFIFSHLNFHYPFSVPTKMQHLHIFKRKGLKCYLNSTVKPFKTNVNLLTRELFFHN